MSKKQYLKRKELGLCVECGGEIEEYRKGKTTCESCKIKNTIRAQETREFRRRLGFCPRCGVNKLFGEEKNCPECRAKNYKYQSPEKKIQHAKRFYERRKELYAERKDAGICVYCGKREAKPGQSSCVYCLAKNREYKRGYNLRNKDTIQDKHEFWRDNNLCSNCGQPLKEGFKVCEECYSKILIVNSSEKLIETRNKLKQQYGF